MRLGALGDEVLARMFATGSERAFTAIYERHHRALYGYCRSIVGDESDAQDALQAALTGALVALRAGRRDAPLRPWLFRIAHNESISLLRRRRFTVELDEAPSLTGSSAEEDAFARLALGSLLSDLAQLGDRQRSALVMRELSGLSHADIAIALEASVGTVKQTIFEARRALVEFEEGRAMDCEHVQRLISNEDRRVLRGRRVRAHLSDCSVCATFANSIPARREQLQAFAVPLAPAAAAALLSRVGHGATGHGGGVLVAGTAGKSAGSALLFKSLLGVAILTTGTLGATRVIEHASPRARASSQDHRPPLTTRATTPIAPNPHTTAPRGSRLLAPRHSRTSGSTLTLIEATSAPATLPKPVAAAGSAARHGASSSRGSHRAPHASTRHNAARAPRGGAIHRPPRHGAKAPTPPAGGQGRPATGTGPVATRAPPRVTPAGAPAVPTPGSSNGPSSAKPEK